MRRIAFVLSFLILLPLHAYSQTTASWTVKKITGVAYIAQTGKKAEKVRKGSVLHPGQTLSTQNRTRLLLIRGKESIQVGPGAIMAIPPAKYSEPGKTTILQQSGRLQLSVNKQNVQHFAVRTPYLTAVVKGTVFSVDVSRNRAEVSVSRGRVEVSDGATGDTTDIVRGQKASVAQTAKGKTLMTVQAKGKKPVIRRIRAKITKPQFYATVKVEGKKVALKPGSKTETTSLEEAREEATEQTTTSSSSSNQTSNSTTSSYASRNVSIENSDSNRSSSSESSNSRSSSRTGSSSSDSVSTPSSTSPGNSNGAGNSSNSNASSNATNNSNAGGNSSSSSSNSSSSSSSSSSSTSTSPGNSNGAGNSSNSNASSNATNNSNAGGNSSSSSSNSSSSSSSSSSSTSTSPGNSNGAGNSSNSNASSNATNNSNAGKK